MDAAELARLLRERVTYDAKAGALYRKSGFAGLPAGQRLGSPDTSGKRQTTFAGKRYRVDALIWLLETGSLPDGPLGHKTRDNLDDRFWNLRLGKNPSPGLSSRAKVFLSRAAARFPEAQHDLSAVKYVDHDTAVQIACPKHGTFKRKPSKYLASTHGCQRCCTAHHVASVTKTEEQRKETERQYRKANRALYSASSARYHRKNIRTNPGYAVAMACRNLLARVLHDTKRAKANRTAAMLGYSFMEFKAHIEQQFEPWMSWANHGEWHVDHIYPVSRFIRDGVTDVKVINALTNLRPLAKQANLVKKDRLVGLVA